MDTAAQLVADGLASTPIGWAIEVDTGLPRHISELPRERTGGSSGVRCVACGKLLDAFNAGASNWQHRPHFRHQRGTQSVGCGFASLQLGLARTLEEAGLVELPQRSRPGHAVGLSGTRYEAWSTHSPETIRIAGASYRDSARAILTMPDGRRIAVNLVAQGVAADAGATFVSEEGLASLWLNAGAAAEELALLEPEELRRRLELQPSLMDWRKHWRDSDLEAEAGLQAAAAAYEALDAAAPGEDLNDVPVAGRRETVLHRRAREIVRDAGALQVPGWLFEVPFGEPRYFEDVPAHWLRLQEVVEERGLAGKTPDLQCQAVGPTGELSMGRLVLEVIVTNPVPPEKLKILVAAGAGVLAVDLRPFGGLLTMTELRQLLVDDLACKVWLHHPLHANQMEKLQFERDLVAAHREFERYGPMLPRDDLERFRVVQKEAPAGVLLDLGRRYLDAVTDHKSILIPEPHRRSISAVIELARKREAAWERVLRAAVALHAAGCPGGADKDLSIILTRLLSIYHDRGVGYKQTQNARATINHVATEVQIRNKPQRNGLIRPSPDAALVCMAFKVYEVEGRRRPVKASVKQFTQQVHASLLEGSGRFMWPSRYEPIIVAMFPELRPLIDRLRANIAAAAVAPP